jgi:glutathione S-transferase
MPAQAAPWLLYSSPTSPFVRKVRIVAIERGLIGRIHQVQQNPFVEDAAFVASNPIAQIPTLEAEGLIMTDSALIVDWLEARGEGPPLVPTGEAQWEVRQRVMFADGVQQCGIRWRIENLRDPSARWPEWVDRLHRGLQRGFDRLEETLPGEEVFDLGVINAVIAASYLSYRHPGYDWRTGRPRLVARVDMLERTRPSFVATLPGTPLEHEAALLAGVS